MSSLVTCTVTLENNNKMAGHNDRLANGINVGTNYRLLSIDKVQYFYPLCVFKGRSPSFSNSYHVYKIVRLKDFKLSSFVE